MRMIPIDSAALHLGDHIRVSSLDGRIDTFRIKSFCSTRAVDVEPVNRKWDISPSSFTAWPCRRDAWISGTDVLVYTPLCPKEAL